MGSTVGEPKLGVDLCNDDVEWMLITFAVMYKSHYITPHVDFTKWVPEHSEKKCLISCNIN